MRALMTFAAALVFATSAAAQPQQPAAQAPPPGAPPLPPAGAPITAGEVQKFFEAYTVMQAQDALQLTEAQYGRFVTRLKALQDTRRRHQQARNQIIVALRQMTNGRISGDDQAIADRLKALRDEDERATGDVRKAYDAVDETLDTRQQARFRLFEERMEQQRLELLMRARQNARPARGRGK
jgi:hypothetical protein